MAPTSSMAAALIYHMIVEQLVWDLTERGVPIPIFISMNVPGAKEHNEKMISKYRSRIRNL
jgi:uncharacterized phosphosugar-binding protein